MIASIRIMGRKIRHFEPGRLTEITARTFQGRYLLRPDPVINGIIAGVIGRAQRRYQMTIHGLGMLSNHEHFLVTPSSASQLASFMNYVNGNIAREVARHTGWHGKVWDRRYVAIPVSDEEAAQADRLRYILAQGVKEGLVERPQDWPGVHCARALLDGSNTLAGSWVDRTREYRARLAGRKVQPGEFEEPETIVLSPLPCWAHLAPEDYRARIAEIVEAIVAEARVARGNRPVLGRKRILRQTPTDRPPALERSPAPAVHAATHRVRLSYRTAYREFVAAFRAAAERLRGGDLTVVFPPGAFPPAFPRPLPA